MSEIKKTKNGLIVLYVFMIMVTLSAMVYVHVQGSLDDSRLFSGFESEKKAGWLAQGGIEKARAVLSKNPSYRGSLPEETLNNGRILVEILDNNNGKIIIYSTGISGNETVKIESGEIS